MKLPSLIGLLIFISALGFAENTSVHLQTQKTSSNNNQCQRPRSPMHLPISVVFNDDINSIEVSSPSHIEGEVFLYNENGFIEDYSPQINCTLYLSGSGIHTICIKGDSWTAHGYIEN